MSRTKIVAAMTLTAAVLDIVIDALNGGGFDLKSHVAALLAASGSLGLYFLRDAVQKVQDAVGVK